MTASAKTCITSHSGSILTRNGYGLYTNPFRGFGSGRVRFQFDDPTYDPRGNWYHSGAQWVQVSTSPNIWDYWREATDWSFEFGGVSYDSQARIKSPCSVLVANLEGVTDIGYIFQLCTNIHDIYNFYAPDVTNVQHAFDTCANLETCEILSLGSATSFYRLFAGCRSMEKAPMFDFPAEVTDVSVMFGGCTSLVNVPLYDTSHVTNFGSYSGSTWGMFGGCTSIEHVPQFDTGAATDMSGMFYGCSSLVNTPVFNTANCHYFINMFTNCTSLKHVPQYDMTGCNATIGGCRSMFYGCTGVEDGALALYDRMLVQTGGYPPYTGSTVTAHSRNDMFKNCGANTASGLAELQQIPTSWGGLKEE